MIAAWLISFREGLEASLIVGIVMGYLRKAGHDEARRYAWAGVLVAILASVVLAIGIQTVGAELEGRAEELFEGATMFLAVGVLTWMIFWMRYQARRIRSTLERDVQSMVGAGRHWGLAAVTFVAVFREGVETVLFLSAAVFAIDGARTLQGAVLGLLSAALLGFLLYATTIRLDLRLFFNLTSALLLIFAAGLFAHGVHELQEAGVILALDEQVWDVNHILDEASPLGQVLRSLIGYNGNPSLGEVLAYWGYWLLALFGIRWLVDQRVARLEG